MVKNKNKKSSGKKIWLILFLVLLIVAIVVGVMTFCPCKKGNMKRYDYKITSADGKTEKVSLKLEVADNDEARLTGLMNRKKVPENTGMIFDFEKPDYYSMWMKNTYVPLDMIFFNNDGVVVAYEIGASPLSEDYINPCNLEYRNISYIHSNDKDYWIKNDVDSFFDRCEAKYSKPENATRYVIEIPAGTIEKAGITYGDKLLK